MRYVMLAKLISWIFPTKADRMHFRCWCKELDSRKDICQIKNNYQKCLEKWKNKPSAQPVRVLFLVSDVAKWKAQSLYDLMDKSTSFNPVIALTLSDYQLKLKRNEQQNILEEGYKYFNSKSMNCVIAYNVENNKALNLDEFKADVVFYQQPWQICKNQMPKAVSEYALTCYIPYYVQNYGDVITECHQELHQTVFRYYILNKDWELQYCSEFQNAAGEIVGLGHTMLDEYYLKKDISNEGKYVIYAPHHSVNNYLGIATFHKNGKDILEYAKAHKELNWVFKPHPNLKYRVVQNHIMSQKEIDEYYKDWESFATVCYDSDYADYFLNSKALITDSASFLTEYFCTGKPIIHLISNSCNVIPQRSFKKILDTFYKVNNKTEMIEVFNNILIKNEDYLKDIRHKMLEQCGLAKTYAAENILKDLSEVFAYKTQMELLTNENK